MKVRQNSNKIIVRIDKGEELVESIMSVVKSHQIRLGSLIGIGATNKVTIGLYDVDKQKYHSKEFNGNFEIAPVVGNITTMNDDPYLHLHINICDERHHSFGGHLNSAVISATCECIIDVIDGSIDRFIDGETGLNLLDIN
jgi:predicted DNA-binding protein with PD1-like motif